MSLAFSHIICKKPHLQICSNSAVGVALNCCKEVIKNKFHQLLFFPLWFHHLTKLQNRNMRAYRFHHKKTFKSFVDGKGISVHLVVFHFRQYEKFFYTWCLLYLQEWPTCILYINNSQTSLVGSQEYKWDVQELYHCLFSGLWSIYYTS